MHPDLQLEQDYFDLAHKYREARRARLLSGDGSAAAVPKAGAAINRSNAAAFERLGSPNDPVAMQRFDAAAGEFDGAGSVVYIGRCTILDDSYEPVVIAWQSDLAASLLQATREHPGNVARKRIFETERNTIVDIRDDRLVVRVGEEHEVEIGPDPLLRELARSRDGRLTDMVRTIQAAQDRVMRLPAQGVLVIQGGPGTGKTVVGLQRISVLLYRDQIEAKRMLFVGPNRGFIRYVENVLPSLGDGGVPQLAVTDLSPFRLDRLAPEAAEVARVKGDGRMAGVLAGALRSRITIPTENESIRVGTLRTTIRAERLGRIITETISMGQPFSNARTTFRERLISYMSGSSVGNDTRSTLSGLPAAQSIRSSTEFQNLIDRIWPTFSPQEFLRDLLNSVNRLNEFVTPTLGSEAAKLLYRPAQTRIGEEPWTASDIALIDELAELLDGKPGDQYAHVVVDEAQDLSPMQLRSLQRRSAGAMTLVGDLAQATGAWGHRSWDEVIDHLAPETHEMVELEIGYRVPAEVMRIASLLAEGLDLPVKVPDPIRHSGEEPIVVFADGEPVLRAAVSAVKQQLGFGRNVALICPDAVVKEATVALDYEQVAWGDGRKTTQYPVTVLRASESKGLEFDAVVIVEPGAIVDQSPQGLNELFVATTRTTRSLTIVHQAALPEQLQEFAPPPAPEPAATEEEPVAQPEPASQPDEAPEVTEALEPELPMVVTDPLPPVAEPQPTPTATPFEKLILDAAARSVAKEIAGTLRPEMWSEFVERLRQVLEEEST